MTKIEKPCGSGRKYKQCCGKLPINKEFVSFLKNPKSEEKYH